MKKQATLTLFLLLSLLVSSSLLAQVVLPWHQGFETVRASAVTGNSTKISGLNGVEFKTNNKGRLTFSSSTSYYHSGKKSVTLDIASFAGVAKSQLIFDVDLSNYSTAQLRLSFWYLNDNSNKDSLNKVWIRGSDTETWIEAFDLDSSQSLKWKYASNIDIDSILKANSQIVTKSFQLKFGQSISYYPKPHNTFTIDDITIDESVENNGSLESLESYCYGLSPVEIKLTNAGNNTIKSGQISWSVNGIAQSTAVFKTNILAGKTELLRLGSHFFTPGKPDTFVIKIDSINGTIDSANYNDTLQTIISKTKSMNGDYTVGSSGSDFSSLKMALDTLKANGVCGPVTFRVKSGTYTGQVILDSIAGASKRNTIRIVGDNVQSTVLTFAATNYRSTATMHLNNASFYIIDSLTIRATGKDYGIALLVEGSSNYNSITNCMIEVSTTSSMTAYFRAVDIFSDRSASLRYQKLELVNNRIIGGYYGVKLRGFTLSNPLISHFIIKDNEIFHQSNYSIHATECFGLKILSNVIDSITSADGVGIHSYSNGRDSIISNKIISPSHGIYLFRSNYYWNNDTSFVVNNMVSGHYSYMSNSLYGSLLKKVQILGNSFNSLSTYGLSSNATLYIDQSSDLTIQNNIFSNHFNGLVFYAEISYLDKGAIDYNNYFTNNSSGSYLNSRWYVSLKDLQAGDTTQNKYSVSIDPEFFTANDLHTISYNLNNKGKNLKSFNYDLDSEKRPSGKDTSFDIGADDYYRYPFDADLVAIDNTFLKAGPNTLSIQIKNNGTSTWNGDSIFIEYFVDSSNVIKDTVIVGVVKPDSIWSFNFSVPYSLTGKGLFRNACVQLTSQFKGVDPDSLNDRICKSICAEFLNDVITVADTGADFKSISAVLNHLHCSGISKPTIIRVAKGKYVDQINIRSIRGTSAVNTVRIVGNDNGTSITNDGSISLNTVLLDSASYLIFDSLSIETTHTDGKVFLFSNNSNHNIIQNCTLKAPPSNSNKSIVIAALGAGKNGNYNTIKNNRIEGGYAGILWSSSHLNSDRGNGFWNNTLRNQYAYPLALYYNKQQHIVGNDIDSMSRTISYGIHLSSSSKDSIASNRIVVDGTGILIDQCDSGYVVNNMLSGSSSYGSNSLKIGYSTNYQVIGNSIWNKNMSTSYTNSSTIELGSVEYSVIKNNSVYREYDGYVLYVNHSYPGTIDYNNYYAPNSKYIIHYWGAYSDLSSHTTTHNQDSNSITVDPKYFAYGDLKTKSSKLNNKGDNLKNFAFDFYGNQRPAQGDSLFDIGAYEYYLDLYDADIVNIELSSLTKGNSLVRVTVKNTGINTWYNEKIHLEYTVDSGTVVKETFTTGTVVAGDTVSFAFKTPFQPGSTSFANGYKICANIGKRFMNKDPDLINEHFCKSTCVDHQKAVITVGSLGKDFTSINEALNYLSCAGISNPLTIRVSKGLYQEQVNIPLIQGVSKINTIRIVGEGDSSIISHNARDGHHTLKLDNISYFTFDSLTIQTTSDSSGLAIFLTNGSSYNHFTNCRILASSKTTDKGNVAIRANGSETTLANNCNYNVFSNNRIIGGYYGVVIRGYDELELNEGNQIIGNHFSNQYYFGAYLIYANKTMFSHNQIDSASYSNGVGFYCTYGGSNSVISNKFKSTYRGIQIRFENYMEKGVSIIANNTIVMVGSKADLCGLHGSSTQNTKFLHNSVLVTNNSTKNMAAYFYQCEDATIANNIFMNSGGGLAFSQDLRSYSKGYFDNNNYYAPNSTNIADVGGLKSSITQVKSISSSQNQNSISTNPYFTSNSDLHAGAVELMESGKSLGITTDFDGELRSKTKPDIGADEIKKDLNINHVLQPNNSCRSINTKDSVVLALKNEGPSILTSEDIIVIRRNALGNIEIDTVKIPKGSMLIPGQTLNLTLPNPYITTSSGLQHILFQSEYSRDSNYVNDTITHQFYSYALPKASFTTSLACSGQKMKIVNTSTNAASYTWDFGDGSSDTIKSPNHLFAKDGNYSVRLIALSTSICSDTMIKNITVHATPIAQFKHRGECLGDSVFFTNESQGGLDYNWTFGDGKSNRDKNPIHLYQSAGDYSVVLEVSSDKKCSSTDTAKVSIAQRPVEPDWAYTTLQDLTLRFELSNQIDTSAATYNWDFGNGKTAIGASVKHSFDTAGIYSIICTATNLANCSRALAKVIGIQPNSIYENDHLFDLQAFPNPFKDAATLKYGLKKNSYLTLEVVDIYGRVLYKIVDAEQSIGLYTYELTKENINYSSGMLIIRATVNGSVTYLNLMKM